MVENIRRLDASLIPVFEDVFAAHGCLGYRDEQAYTRIENLSEWRKLSLVPLVFSLIPESAISTSRDLNTKVKPQIRRHVETLGLSNPSERLLTILKRLADNYFSAKVYDRNKGGVNRKMGFSDLKARRILYEMICSRQKGRCALCGDLFQNISESLDHVIPHSLGGDPQDGSNWQILCESCNVGKSNYISAYQSPAALNWIYSSGLPTNISSELRYVTLSQLRRCQFPNCESTSKTSKLVVDRVVNQGLLIASHVTVLCEMHTS